jgi:hypothetical protein
LPPNQPPKRSRSVSVRRIAFGKSQTSIKFALIDEILFVPPVPSDISQAELQRWQGSGVIREITNLRRDIQFIIVTSAPQLRSHGDLQLFTRETSKLRRQTNVIDIIHKQDIEADPDREYRWLIEDIFNRPQIDTDLPCQTGKETSKVAIYDRSSNLHLDRHPLYQIIY